MVACTPNVIMESIYKGWKFFPPSDLFLLASTTASPSTSVESYFFELSVSSMLIGPD